MTKSRLRILPDEPIEQRIATALVRVAEAGRLAAWREAYEQGLSPTQAHVLELLSRASLRVSALAEAMGVTAATTSDAVRALVDKGLVAKERSADDARAVQVALTSGGRRLARASAWTDVYVAAVATLRPEAQHALLRSLAEVIGALQQSGSLSGVRTCLGCRYFRESVHAGAKPHHCDFVDAPFGAAELRTHCPDHEPQATRS